MESIHKILEKVRKPRVHIQYEVETEDATILKELPFVIGVLGDFSADGLNALKPLKDKKFINIDRDNFDDVIKNIAPELNLKIKNTINNDNSDFNIHLKFQSFQDFEPENIVEQVPILKKLLQTRTLLTELLTKVDRSEELENILEIVLQEKSELKKLSAILSNNSEA